jgi:hypothetical protein
MSQSRQGLHLRERRRTMTRPDLLSRLTTAAALIASAVALGVWLTLAPLTAAPPVKIAPEPILAPTPTPPTVTPTTIEVPVEVEIAAPIAAVPEPLAAKVVEPRTEPRPACQPCRRGLFRRR